ncbi:protein kinase domain-containing protein [Zymomonas mobilis]|uniref:protein kinase domain-containing protein n=1 Tax=Zymomonas mobilis TaxID=542 RepID=UPI0039ECC80B
MNPCRAQTLHRVLVGKFVGGWLIGDLIGYGGSAAVFSAIRNGQEAALKVIDPELLDEFGREQQSQRIVLEARLVGEGHPNLVKLFEAGECLVTRHLYVAMAKLPYRTLTATIGSIPAEAIGKIVEQIASAAQYLDQCHICHQDIKPDNVMVSDDFAHAVLMDLGIISPFDAAVAGSVDPSGERFIGTARYCPGEFIRNQVTKTAVGYRAVTFYQLGGLLHDMIMQQRLFDQIDGPYARLIDAIDTVTPVVESDKVPRHLLYLARDCLRKTADDRTRLVTWNRFRATEPNASLDARLRVRASLSSLSVADVGKVSIAPRIDRTVLLELGRMLRDRLAAVCDGNTDLLIPSIDVDVVGHVTQLTAEFEPVPARGLYRKFRILFQAEPVLGADLVFLLDAEVSASGQKTTEPPSRVRICIVRDLNYDPSIDFEDFLYKVIADQMGQPAKSAGRSRG